MRSTLAVTLIMLPLWANAEVYRCERGGRMVYTDQPCNKNAKPAALPEINFVGTPGASQSDKELARQWDQRIEKGKRVRSQSDKAWLDSHAAAQKKEERIRAAFNRHKVVKGMTPQQVRQILGDPDAQSIQDGREDITIWSYKPDNGPQHTISFRGGEVNSVSTRKGKKKS